MRPVFALVCLAAIAACASEPDPAASNASQAAIAGRTMARPALKAAEETVPASGPSGAAKPIQLDHRFLVGRWTDDGDCSNAIALGADGTFATGGTTGLWVIDSNALTLQADRTLTLRLHPVDRSTLIVINPGGSLGRSTRC